MKILFICYELPTPVEAATHRTLYSLKYLSEKYGHDISLRAFRLPGKEYADLSDYCHIKTVDIAHRPGLGSPKVLLHALWQAVRPQNIFSSYSLFFSFSYSTEMDRRIKELMDHSEFDVMVIDHPPMLRYALNRKLPTLLLETFTSGGLLMAYKLERNWIRKAIRLLFYYQTRNYPRAYRSVSACVAVSSSHRHKVRSYCPDSDIVVIPHGIDTDYFRQVEPETDFPNLVISGTMRGLTSENAILSFYNEVYPLIKARVPQVKLYIVGRGPSDRILKLTEDKSVIVTGFVKDLRPYLSNAWVVVAPLNDDIGVKIRVLQAMAVGKPVVSTSMVTAGIDVSHGENIILADKPLEFADRVVELLNDRPLRERIGANARKLMETNHSWGKLADKLNEVLEKVAKAKSLPKEK